MHTTVRGRERGTRLRCFICVMNAILFNHDLNYMLTGTVKLTYTQHTHTSVLFYSKPVDKGDFFLAIQGSHLAKIAKRQKRQKKFADSCQFLRYRRAPWLTGLTV